MDRIIKSKMCLELVTSHSSGYKTSSKNFFISYVLPDQVIISLPFALLKCGKEGKKLQKFEYLENEKSFAFSMK